MSHHPLSSFPWAWRQQKQRLCGVCAWPNVWYCAGERVQVRDGEAFPRPTRRQAQALRTQATRAGKAMIAVVCRSILVPNRFAGFSVILPDDGDPWSARSNILSRGLTDTLSCNTWQRECSYRQVRIVLSEELDS